MLIFKYCTKLVKEQYLRSELKFYEKFNSTFTVDNLKITIEVCNTKFLSFKMKIVPDNYGIMILFYSH